MWQLLHDWFWGAPPGVQRHLLHDYPWPYWTAGLLVLVGWLFVAVLYMRETGRRSVRLVAALLRALAVLLVVGVFLHGWKVVTDITDLPDLVVIVDDSASMFEPDVRPDRAGTASRWTRWEWIQNRLREQRWLEQWKRRYRVKLYRMAAEVRPVEDPESDESWRVDPQQSVHQASRLGTGLRAVLDQQRGRPTAALVLLSDGITTDGPTLVDVAPYARRLGIPIFTVGVGEEHPSRDFFLADILGDDVVFVGDVAQFEVRIGGRGAEKERLRLTVHRKEDGRLLAEVPVDWSPGAGLMSVPIGFRADSVGSWNVVFDLRPQTPDINPGNNRVERHISVRDDPLRVLYVQQYPSFDYRYLKTLLERGLHRSGNSGKAIELSVVLQEADVDFPVIDRVAIRAFPIEREVLFRYDVVIFGDVDPALFGGPLLENLAAFVEERGGGLVVICGPRNTPWSYRNTPLARLLPVAVEQIEPPLDTTDAYQVEITALGRQSPLLQVSDDPAEASQLWSRMPPLYWVAQSRQLRPAARVLMEARGRDGRPWPVLVDQFVGAGKVVMVLTDELYRWAKHPDGDLYYARFWLQTLRYLSRAKLLGTDRVVELSVDRDSYQPAETVSITARYLDERQAPANEDTVTVIIEQRAGPRFPVALRRDGLRRGIFRGTWLAPSEGEYRVWLERPTDEGHFPSTRFTVRAPRGERAQLELDVEQLRRTAELSGGRYYNVEHAAQLMDDLPQGRQVRIESLPPQPIWNHPVWIALFVLLVSAEWVLRKWAGMV
jgi:uncharacterized membrane protein